MLLIARENPLESTGKKAKGPCDPIIGMCNAARGRPNVFYLLIFVQCCVWLGNSVWGMYGKEYFTKSVYEGDQTAPPNTMGYDQYVAGNSAFSHGGMVGMVFNLFLALAIMGLGFTKIPSHLIYAPCVLLGAVVCFLCAFSVHHNHQLALVCFILSQAPLTATGSIPYGLVAVWNRAEEQRTGKVGSAALQMAFLNCCITVGQLACTNILALFEFAGQDEAEAMKSLFIISIVVNGVAGICIFFLGGGPTLEDSTAEVSEMGCRA